MGRGEDQVLAKTGRNGAAGDRERGERVEGKADGDRGHPHSEEKLKTTAGTKAEGDPGAEPADRYSEERASQSEEANSGMSDQVWTVYHSFSEPSSF